MVPSLDTIKIVKALAPSDDVYNTNPSTDEVNMGLYDRATFLLFQKTAGTNTGTATITMRACSANDGSNAEAIAFRYRKIPTGTSDTIGAWTTATTSGFVTTAN